MNVTKSLNVNLTKIQMRLSFSVTVSEKTGSMGGLLLYLSRYREMISGTYGVYYQVMEANPLSTVGWKVGQSWIGFALACLIEYGVLVNPLTTVHIIPK